MSESRRRIEFLILAVILVVAAYFRWTGLAWDSGYLFHPDERQIILVVSNLQLPSNLPEFLSPASPLNPKFFAYGSFPLYLLRLLVPLSPPTGIVGPWADDQLARWVLFGRWLSGLFDLGTILITFALGRRIYDARVGLVSAALITVTVLHIQLSHFYAVDTLLAFFMMGTLYCAFRVAQNTISGNERWWRIALGVCFGLAMATKITALPLVVTILYACYRSSDAPSFGLARARLGEIWRRVRRPLSAVLGISLAVFVVTQPYALIDWYVFGRDVIRETFVARGWLDYPYTRQFAGTLPFVYQVTQGVIWGMGLPLGVFAWGGGALYLVQWWKKREWRDTFVLSFALVYFVTIGLQYTKYLRYLLPLLPVLYLMASVAFLRLMATRQVAAAVVVASVLTIGAVYALAFLGIYSKEHPWLTASRWIYQNIPPGKTLLVEEWDDALPTLIRDTDGERRGSDYTQIALPLYDEDDELKRVEFANALSRADYVIVASQRLYGSIGKLPDRYPLTNRYYAKLFDGELGFAPVMTIRSDPTVDGMTVQDDPFAGLPFDVSGVENLLVTRGTTWNWGFADESFSVYDHPQPIIFQNVRGLSLAEMEKRLR